MATWFAIRTNGDTVINVKTHIRATEPDADRHPEKKIVLTTVLHQGPKVKKEAKLLEICSPRTGEHKNFGLTLTSKYQDSRPDQSISLQDGKKERSISALRDFLVGTPQIDTAGEYRVVDVMKNPFGQLVGELQDSSIEADDISAIVEILRNPSTVSKLASLSKDKLNVAQGFAAAVNYTRMSQTLDEFERLVKYGCSKCEACATGKVCLESTFQNFLKANPWIFGSQYSQVTSKKITFDNDELDYLARRTADGYEEIIEIKRPIKDLFRTRGQKGLAEKSAVVDAVNQVDNYIAGLDADRYKYASEDHGYLKVEKIRAKIIIGRDSDDPAKIGALRRLNARYNRIEVVTYDQLIANARQVLSWLETEIEDKSERSNSQIETSSSIDDIPF